MTALRRVLVGSAALVLALLAVRVAAVLAFTAPRPDLAAAWWPSHPSVVLDRGLRTIGAGAATGRAPDPALTAGLRSLVARDPLNPGPLLVEGTDAFARGDLSRGERLLSRASQLDPLGPAPRFLLAQLYLRQGRAAEALGEIGFLFERLQGDAAPLVPALAQYAAQPGAAAQLKPVLDRQPTVRGQVLSLLADDPANLPTILALAPAQGGANETEWREHLLSALVRRGEFTRADAVWRRFAGLGPTNRPALFNPGFAAGGPPPPFNWRLTSSAAGTAEPRSGGGLHLLHFGREEVVLADQLLLLPAGRYRLDFAVSGTPTGLSWSLTCVPGTARQEAELIRQRFAFVVPAQGCPAQRLELRGAIGDTPGTVDVTLGPVTLRREERS